jgi:hypothetical protein
MTVHLNPSAFRGSARSLESWHETMHHFWLIFQFWLNETDAEQFAHINNVRCSVVAPPRFGRRNWLVFKDGEEQRVASANIQRVTGSLNEGLGK